MKPVARQTPQHPERSAMSSDAPVTRRDVLKAGMGLAALSVLDACGGGDDSDVEQYRSLRGASRHRRGPRGEQRERISSTPRKCRVPLPEPIGGFKDASGALKRQAARFRIYGYDAAGAVVREITASEARHHVDRAPRQREGRVVRLRHRARRAGGASRQDAAIRPTPAAARNGACDRPGPAQRDRHRAAMGPAFDTGRFLGASVYLGELRTDDAGRLVVLGGRGHSFAPRGEPLTTFAQQLRLVRRRLRRTGAGNDARRRHDVRGRSRLGRRCAAGLRSARSPPGTSRSTTSMLRPACAGKASCRTGRCRLPTISTRCSRGVVEMQWVNAGVLRDNGPGNAGRFSATVIPRAAQRSDAPRARRCAS